MAEFDATLKQLVRNDPEGWLRLIDMPAGRIVPRDPKDTDVSTVSRAVDSVLRVLCADPYVLHSEFQVGPDLYIDDRCCFYNGQISFIEKMPVRTVLILLSKKADGKHIKGGVERFSNDPAYHMSFRYRVMRAWEIPIELILNRPVEFLPLAPLANVTRKDLPGIIQRIDERFQAETTPVEARELWATLGVLAGLRYKAEFAHNLLKGVRGMKESSTYMAIWNEAEASGEIKGEARGEINGEARGKVEGKVEEAQRMLLRVGAKRLGAPSGATTAAIERITCVDTLEDLTVRSLDLESWSELGL